MWIAIEHHFVGCLDRLARLPWLEHFAVVLVDGARAHVRLVHVVVGIEYLLHLRTRRLGRVLILLLLLACVHVLRSVSGGFGPADFFSFDCGVLAVLVATRHALFEELKTALCFAVVLARVVGRQHLVAGGLAHLIPAKTHSRGAHATPYAELSTLMSASVDVLLRGVVVRLRQV